MKAAEFAAGKHRGDLRKGTEIPYLSHLWSVAALVLEHGGDDEQVMAALLHDVAEDHGGETVLAEIRIEFGEEVGRLVAGLSDSLVDTSTGEVKPPWKTRKERYLAHLAEADARTALVSACDKLHNSRCILADLRRVGPELWQRFSVTDPSKQLWYYDGLVAALAPPKVPDTLADELARTVRQIRTLTEHSATEAGPATGSR